MLRKNINYPRGWNVPGKHTKWEEHALINPKTLRVLPLPKWEWADLDGERLVWAAEGILYGGRLTADGLVDEQPLFDFRETKFSRVEAPY